MFRNVCSTNNFKKRNFHSAILWSSLLSLVLTWKTTQAQNLAEKLKTIPASRLAMEAERRGNPKRGALIYYQSPAGCSKCHEPQKNSDRLGPDLSRSKSTYKSDHLVEALLHPSKSILEGYATTQLSTFDGKTIAGNVIRESADQVVLRDSKDMEKVLIVRKRDIEERQLSQTSMMPEGLVAVLRDQREFLDLVAYLIAINKGGPARAAELRPLPAELRIIDDIGNLDHAGIIRGFSKRDLNAGRKIYEGLCINCHGLDGNKPSLASARAFGQQPLKFGADYYSMFLTLSRGNGLMAPTLHLSPQERYQVIHFIQQQFMRASNPQFKEPTETYLAKLPRGTNRGEFKPESKRDFGPALASQLGREITSALSIKLKNGVSIAYNLHSMDTAAVWRGDFLNLDATQHIRGRGEGVALPDGEVLAGISGWKWGHEQNIDYPKSAALPRGPLPRKWMSYDGYYLNGEHVVLSYSIDGRKILELPNWNNDFNGVERILEIGPGQPLVLCVAEPQFQGQAVKQIIQKNREDQGEALTGAATNSVATIATHHNEKEPSSVAAIASGDVRGMTWNLEQGRQMILQIPASKTSRLIRILTTTGLAIKLNQLDSKLQNTKNKRPSSLIRGGKLQWPAMQKTIGYHGFEQGAYVLDSIGIPDQTPWNTWFRTSALDFYPDGRMVVATHGGDIWIVSGVDHDLMNLSWKRFAAGLYEPFGVKVVGDQVYVTCKDRLIRLHDLNKNGEADFYESFSADDDVSSFFHAFNFDLQTDSEGNFYYAKAGQYTSYRLPGAIIKVSPDGKTREVFCTGFRTPNGLGILPDDRLTASDNQGNWIPASKISLLKKHGFYGYVQTHARGNLWAPDGGRIDHTRIKPPENFDPPLIWMPQTIDNSSGGQIWVDDPRWGPLSNRLLHTSFGKGWLFYLMIQDVGDVSQAAIIKLPHDFATGIMRGRVNPKDGQVYVTGLNGWNGGGRKGLADKGIQRLRYTGKPYRMVNHCRVESDALVIDFSFPLQSNSLSVKSFQIRQWNYRWQSSYGSKMYHPVTGKPGMQEVSAERIELAPNRRTVKINLSKLKPVNQIQINLSVEDEQGNHFEEEIYWTINRVPH